MATSQTTLTPHTQAPLVTRHYPSEAQLDATILASAAAQKSWARVPLAERIAIGRKFIVRFTRLDLFLSFC